MSLLHSVLLVSALAALASPTPQTTQSKIIKGLLRGKEGILGDVIFEYLKEKAFIHHGPGSTYVQSLDYHRIVWLDTYIIADITARQGGLRHLDTFPCSAVIYLQLPIPEEHRELKNRTLTERQIRSLFVFDRKKDLKCVKLREIPQRYC